MRSVSARRPNVSKPLTNRPFRPVAEGTVTRAPEGSRLVRRTFRTPLTTRVLLLSATASVLIGVVLVVLIVAVTGQRDAARSAFRSQEALAAGNQLEKSLITIENGVRGYVASRRERFLDPANEALAGYPGEVRRLSSLVDDDPGQQARAREIGVEIDDYVRLPDIDGFSVAEELTADGGGPAVIVTSSSDDPLYPDRARRTGARGFVAKHDLSGAALQRVLDEPAPPA